MSKNRREFFQKAFLGAGLLASSKAWSRQTSIPMNAGTDRNGERNRIHAGQPFVPVQTPDIPDLPWQMDGDVKVFNLTAEPVKQELVPGQVLDLWGFNGSAPGPTIHVSQGDGVRIIVDNRLPEPFSMHWHGFEIPNNMDGGPGVSQDPIPPGGRFVYEFTLHQAGTFFYHSHMAMQEMMGMLGGFIMYPREAWEPPVDRDFLIMLQEYAALPNNPVPNSMNMEFNWLTFNGKSGPAVTPLLVKLGERVRIRLVNMGMDHHPVHLHGHTFAVTGSEAGRQPREAWGPSNTVLVGVAQARDIEFVADNLGDWMLHCHLPHHMMNQMSSMVGPLTRLGKGMPAGVGMEEGMGMLRGTPGAPTGDDYGTSLGRGLGVGSTNDQRVANGPLSSPEATAGTQHEGEAGAHPPGMNMQMAPEVSLQANAVPGFPQDAFMEGPMMAMDKLVDKPENYGLRPGWSGFMQGMMTFVRVLPPDLFDKIMEMKKTL